jgi:hypothetical protein
VVSPYHWKVFISTAACGKPKRHRMKNKRQRLRSFIRIRVIKRLRLHRAGFSAILSFCDLRLFAIFSIQVSRTRFHVPVKTEIYANEKM